MDTFENFDGLGCYSSWGLLESRLTREAAFDTGVVQVFGCHNYEQRASKKDGLTKSQEFTKAREEGFKGYKRMTLPGKVDRNKPCGVHISDVDSSLNVFINGRSDKDEVRRESTRTRKRARVNYKI